MTYSEKVREAWRLEILNLLAQMPGYSSGQYFLYGCLIDGGLPPPSSDQVATELQWLEEQGLVVIEKTASLDSAKITQRGLDVSKGLAKSPGVAKPRPE